MDNLQRDLYRLHLLLGEPVGQEFLAPPLPIKDFVHYYFTRFVSNLTSVFKDFRTSEIEEFNRRYKGQIDHLLKDPLLKLDGIIVPIPRAMLGSYWQTVIKLRMVLSESFADSLLSDLDRLYDMVTSGDVKPLSVDLFDKRSFDVERQTIGSLYGKTGLTHVLAPTVLGSQKEMSRVNETLILLTSTYYPQILRLQPLLVKIESAHTQGEWSGQDKGMVVSVLMNLAYRLSIFAIVMEHIQDMEHSFTLSLGILLKHKS